MSGEKQVNKKDERIASKKVNSISASNTVNMEVIESTVTILVGSMISLFVLTFIFRNFSF